MPAIVNYLAAAACVGAGTYSAILSIMLRRAVKVQKLATFRIRLWAGYKMTEQRHAAQLPVIDVHAVDIHSPRRRDGSESTNARNA